MKKNKQLKEEMNRSKQLIAFTTHKSCLKEESNETKKKYNEEIEGDYPNGEGSLTQYWENGNIKLRHTTNGVGYWEKYKYDKNGNEIFGENSRGR